MTPHALIDPDLRAALATFPELSFDLDKLEQTRALMARARSKWGAQAGADSIAVRQELTVVTRDGVALRLLVYRPKAIEGLLPVLLNIHGGAFVMGEAEMDERENCQLATSLGLVVASIDYRLAPEHPYPVPLEDCYAGLRHLVANARELWIDTERIAVGGKSAGGGLAAGLCLLARDRGEVEIAHQHLVYPMIDDRPESETPEPAGAFVLRRADARQCWQAYLGARDGDIPAYAAPARAESLAGLPPTFISVGDLDLFASSNIEYAQRLSDAGVPTTLCVYQGAYHGFDMATGAPIVGRHMDDRRHALRSALR